MHAREGGDTVAGMSKEWLWNTGLELCGYKCTIKKKKSQQPIFKRVQCVLAVLHGKFLSVQRKIIF